MSTPNGGVESVIEQINLRTVSTAESEDDASTSWQLQQRLLQEIGCSRTREEALAGILRVFVEAIRPVAVLYCKRDENNKLQPAPDLSPAGTGNLQDKFRQRLIRFCETACENGSVHIGNLDSQQRLATITVPVLFRGTGPDALSAVIARSTAEFNGIVGVLQVVASHITLWNVLEHSQAAESESQNTAALLELLAGCKSCANIKQASITLVNELQQFLQCQCVAVGICGHRRNSCRLEAVSGFAHFDGRAEFANTIEAALDEAILREGVTVWPFAQDSDRSAALAHKQACDIADAAGIISSPLYDSEGGLVGAWLFMGEQDFVQHADTLAFIKASQRQVGSSFQLLQRADMNPFRRLWQIVARGLSSWRAKAAVMVVGVLVAAMFVPVKYKIGCDCQVQPVVRRFIAAPYDGKLEKALVEPGDEVMEGGLLARMDGRELRWELAGLTAEYNRAEKERDSAMAIDSIAEGQQAALEMERLQLKMQLLTNRLENLEIRSPLAGILISGDLKKTEGAPLGVGQIMFEVSPLDRMIVEVEIPEREILHVHAGQQVIFRVDAYPHRTWAGAIAKIFPRSEIREQESVYIAEVDLDNRSGELRPGMKGRARIVADRHALGWNLFHRPYESLCMLIGW